MINIVPKKVLINLIGNIANDQLVEIPQNQLVGILAENKDFGGSNSSGKSNFTYAIPINLFGAGAVGVTNKDIKNDKLKGTPNITAYYDINGKELIVDRIIGGILSVNFDGEQIKGSNDDVQKKLNSIIGLTEEQFKQLAYKDQENAESFLTMKDSEKKDFLSSFFDTIFIDKMKENADIELKKLQQEMSSYEITKNLLVKDIGELKVKLEEKTTEKELKVHVIIQSVATNTVQIQELANRKQQLATQQPESDPTYLEKMHVSAPQIEECNIKQVKIESELLEIKSAIKDNKEKLIQIPEPIELMGTLSQANTFLDSMKASERDLSSLRVKFQIGTNELIKLKNSITGVIKDCPTCKRPMDKEHLELEIKKINDTITSLTADTETLQDHIFSKESSLLPKDSLIELIAQTKNDISNYKETQSAAINQELSNLNNKHRETELTSRELTITKSQLQNQLMSIVSQIKQKLNKEMGDIDLQSRTLVNTNENLLNSIKVLEESLTQYTQSIKDKEVNLHKLIQGNETNLKRIAILSHISFITSKNGFVGHIFDSILDQLNSEIKSNLSMIPVTRDFTVYFKPEKLVKSTGTTNKDITFQFYDGDKEVSFSRVSGGQRLCVTLAVDEALDTVISQVLGIKVGFKVLDEQLHFVDNNSKEAVMEFLRAKSANKTYIIVDHSSELNASFESIIKVTRENGIATITNY